MSPSIGRFSLYICVLLLVFITVDGRVLRGSKQHPLLAGSEGDSTQQKSSPPMHKISLSRDSSVQKKMDMFNFFSQQTAIRNKAASFVALSYDETTQQARTVKRRNTEESKAKFLSLTQLFYFFSDDDDNQSMTKVSLQNHANTFYSGMIGVGDDDQDYKMIFDTGSTLIFLNSLKCSDIGCVRGNQYDSSESDTFKPVDIEVEVEFGSGTIMGDMAIDSFYVGGAEIERVEFIEITKEIGPIFESGSFDGLIGLAFPALGEGVDTLVDSMKDQNIIDTKQISFYMSRVDESDDSFVSFGEIDRSVIDGEIQYHSVANPMYWTLLAEQILLGGEDTGLCSQEKPCALAIDSGTSIVAGPTRALSKLIGSLERMQLECSEIDKMPPLTFVIDGKHYSLLAREYVISADGSMPSLYEHSEEPTQCEPALLGMDIEEEKYGNLWILGDLFMSKYYTVFNRENKTIGFAKLKDIDPMLYQVDIDHNL